MGDDVQYNCLSCFWQGSNPAVLFAPPYVVCPLCGNFVSRMNQNQQDSDDHPPPDRGDLVSCAPPQF